MKTLVALFLLLIGAAWASTQGSNGPSEGRSVGYHFNASLGASYAPVPTLNQSLKSLGGSGVGDFGLVADLGFSFMKDRVDLGMSVSWRTTDFPESGTTARAVRFTAEEATSRLELGYGLGDPLKVLLVPRITLGSAYAKVRFSSNMDFAAFLLNPDGAVTHEFKHVDFKAGVGLDVFVKASRNPRVDFGGFLLKIRYDFTLATGFQANLLAPPALDRHAVSATLGTFIGTVGKRHGIDRKTTPATNVEP